MPKIELIPANPLLRSALESTPAWQASRGLWCSHFSGRCLGNACQEEHKATIMTTALDTGQIRLCVAADVSFNEATRDTDAPTSVLVFTDVAGAMSLIADLQEAVNAASGAQHGGSS